MLELGILNSVTFQQHTQHGAAEVSGRLRLLTFLWAVAKAVTESDWMVICTFIPASLAPSGARP